MGVSAAAQDKKKLDAAVSDLTAIAAQKPVITKAKNQLRLIVYAKVNQLVPRLHYVASVCMILDKLITVALPRIKDFQGLSKSSFDGHGNYAFGIKEHLIFPEISVDKIENIIGMDIVIATTAKTDDEARALLIKLGMPLVLK